MKYRRFGRTGLSMPVFSCGGMRYQYKWQDVDPREVPADHQANLEATIHRALELGINHLETARGYGSSEMQLGKILPTLPRDKIIVQTKVAPTERPEDFLKTFDRSLKYLRLDHVDLLALHGVNNWQHLYFALRKNGCVAAARKLQKEGRARFIGFSTHATTDIILHAVTSDEFDYLNVHWYFVNDLNWPAIQAAHQRDLGVFIISPNDKGGKLYVPPKKLVDLCAPLTPMQFNDLYCLARPEVHTLSCGAAKPGDFDEHVRALDHDERLAGTVGPIEERLRAEMERALGRDWCARKRGQPIHYCFLFDLGGLLQSSWTMPRKLRIEYPGAIYHVMSRGNRREDIFLDDVDRQDFLKTLAEACQKTSWQVHAYCLMRNHYHLVLETPNANLVAGMAWLQSTYTIRLNHRHKLVGHVLSGRYKAQLVEGGGNGYLRTACDYVHLNPVRAHLLKSADRLLAYPWSSFGYYLSAPEHRPHWMRVDRLLGEHGIGRDTPAGRGRFEQGMEARRLGPGDEAALKVLRRGWCVGGQVFRQEQLARMEGKLGAHHAGELRRETAEAKAERMIAQALQRLGWRESELVSRRKNDPDKLAIAVRLRRETTLPIKRIAARLHLGTANTASVRLHRALRELGALGR